MSLLALNLMSSLHDKSLYDKLANQPFRSQGDTLVQVLTKMLKPAGTLNLRDGKGPEIGQNILPDLRHNNIRILQGSIRKDD